MPEDANKIQTLIEKRDIARVNREFDKTDEIRSMLTDCGIMLNDKKCLWQVVVDRNDSRSESKMRDKARVFSQRGGGDLSEEDLTLINQLLAKRDVEKRTRKFKSADAICDQYAEKFNISIDDRASEWHIKDSAYAMASDSATVDDKTRQKIQELVVDRLKAREERDYDMADNIRAELSENYGVVVDDRLREWYVE